MKKDIRIKISFAVLFLLAAVFFALNIFTGSTRIPVSEVISVLAGNGIYDGNGVSEASESIILKIRLPRALAAMLLGGALALSGYLLQTLFHNPIAGPFVLGISSGAKLTVSVAVIASVSLFHRAGSAMMVTSAFAGSMLSLGFILLISKRVKRMSMLVVCGVTIGYICSAVTELFVAFADDSDIVNLHNWSMGTFSGTSMDSVKTMAWTVLISSLLTFLLSKPISAYQLGDNYAENSGVNVKRLRTALIVLSGFLSACVTAFAGPVSFVGIAVPHIIRFIMKTSKPIILIPACFLGGGIFCTFCDMAARTLFAPTELSIGTVTAIFGAPVVIIAMVKRKKGEL